jgi:catechol 2,3-dioxygenase-like lactoylglutathione lyase family enzyme
MGITRLNHAVLFVNDIERSVAFYTDVLGFRRIDMTPEGFAGAAFLQAPGSTNDHDLGLFEIGGNAGPSGAGRTTVGLYHLAWEIDTLAEMKQLAASLADNGALAGSSDHGTTKRQRVSTARIRTGWSSRLPGLCRPTSWTTPPGRPASGFAASTSIERSPAMAAIPGVGSGFPSRSADGGAGIVCDHDRPNDPSPGGFGVVSDHNPRTTSVSARTGSFAITIAQTSASPASASRSVLRSSNRCDGVEHLLEMFHAQ